MIGVPRRRPALLARVAVAVGLRLRLAVVAAVAAALSTPAGCITPSIPIPPPEPTEMRIPIDAASGTATFSYAAEINFANALVYVYNRSREVGIIAHARPDGSVGPSLPFPAGDGDNLVITFQAGEESSATCIVISAASPVPSNFCDL
ncbi:MAG TPA: hypothetical protein VHE35_19150 [Kofleriaceae bacterium]|nr:hypothetical protein [Kofleriaceae bacterium]